VWLGNIKKSSNDPEWKIDFIRKNRNFYDNHKKVIDAWLKKHDYLEEFPPSRRKLEWQAGEVKSIYKCLIQLRPSGIRVKKMNYAPALVAITQTTIVGPLRRRLSIREVAQLQGLPSWFSFRTQPLSKSYKQLGNGISIGCAFQVLRGLAERDEGVLKELHPKLLKSIQTSGDNPDINLKRKP
jgi:DNA (cytosine-5)-methyltransferase 1